MDQHIILTLSPSTNEPDLEVNNKEVVHEAIRGEASNKDRDLGSNHQGVSTLHSCAKALTHRLPHQAFDSEETYEDGSNQLPRGMYPTSSSSLQLFNNENA